MELFPRLTPLDAYSTYRSRSVESANDDIEQLSLIELSGVIGEMGQAFMQSAETDLPVGWHDLNREEGNRQVVHTERGIKVAVMNGKTTKSSGVERIVIVTYGFDQTIAALKNEGDEVLEVMGARHIPKKDALGIIAYELGQVAPVVQEVSATSNNTQFLQPELWQDNA